MQNEIVKPHPERIMRKINILCFLILILLGCSHKNEFGMLRRAKNNPWALYPNVNNDAFKLIDTTKLYEIIYAEDLNYKEPLHSVRKRFLKFYSNGRVGEFESYNQQDSESLNPKRADAGFYSYDGKKFLVQFYFKNAQGSSYITKELISSGDNLQFVSGNVLSKYKAHNLSEKFLIFKPDW